MQINIPQDQITAFCQQHHIHKLALFGSVLNEEFGANSDIDVLVEFDPDHVPGFFKLITMQQELETLFAHSPVDLVTPKFLNQRIRDSVLARAEVIYIA